MCTFVESVFSLWLGLFIAINAAPAPQTQTASPQASQTPGEVARALAGEGQLVTLPGEGRVKQSVKTEAQSFALPTGESRAALFKLPDYSAPYTVRITSPCNHGCVGFSKSLFVPTGIFLDAEFQPTVKLDRTEFQILEPGSSRALRLEATVLIDEPRTSDRYLLLYTIGEDVGQVVQSRRIRGAVLWGQYAKVKASPYGTLELDVRPVSR